MQETEDIVARLLTDEQVTAAARVLCRKHSEACATDEQDLWKWYGEDFKEDARAALAAALSVGKPAAWTTHAHIDSASFGKSGLFVKDPGTVFCVPVFFGKPQSIDDHRDPT